MFGVGQKHRAWEVWGERWGEGSLGGAGLGLRAEVLGGVDSAKDAR